MPHDLRHFVEVSLRVLEDEAPMFHARLCRTLQGRRLCIRCDGESFALHFDAAPGVSVWSADTSLDVDLNVDRATLFALLDGELMLEDALRQDHLELRGNLKHLVAVFDGLVVYLRGAVRCPSMPQLLSDFRMFKSIDEI